MVTNNAKQTQKLKNMIVTVKSFLWRKGAEGEFKAGWGVGVDEWGESKSRGEGRGFGNKVTVCYA